jgi:hypothetical protein
VSLGVAARVEGDAGGGVALETGEIVATGGLVGVLVEKGSSPTAKVALQAARANKERKANRRRNFMVPRVRKGDRLYGKRGRLRGDDNQVTSSKRVVINR